MLAEIAALLGGRLGPAIHRAIRLAVFASVALMMSGVALASLAVALYLGLEPVWGSVRAALGVAAAALILAALASLPLWLPRRPPPPPASAALTDLALAAALAFMTRGAKRSERER